MTKCVWIKCHHKVCAWWQTNVHTPRMSCSRRLPVYESPRWVNDMDLEFMGSAQGVPMELQCRWWQSMPVRDTNSPPQYAYLKPNESGNFFVPPGIPPSALRLRRIVWSFIFAASPGPWLGWWVPHNGASTAWNTVNTAGKAAAIPPPPPRRDSSKAQRRQGASPKPRDPDSVGSASRFLIYT